jgi:hypothetical protein
MMAAIRNQQSRSGKRRLTSSRKKGADTVTRRAQVAQLSGRVLPRMIVKRRSLLDESVNVGNGGQDLGDPVGHGFGNGNMY